MCVIIHKLAGKTVKPSDISLMFESNPDGFGAAWIKANGEIGITKGLMKEKDVLAFFRRMGEKEFIGHFRWATHGIVNRHQCHPFIISSTASSAKKLVTETARSVLFHNGVITGFGDKKISDTVEFVADSLSHIPTIRGKIATLEAIGGKFVLIQDAHVWKVGSWDSTYFGHASNLHWQMVQAKYGKYKWNPSASPTVQVYSNSAYESAMMDDGCGYDDNYSGCEFNDIEEDDVGFYDLVNDALNILTQNKTTTEDDALETLISLGLPRAVEEEVFKRTGIGERDDSWQCFLDTYKRKEVSSDIPCFEMVDEELEEELEILEQEHENKKGARYLAVETILSARNRLSIECNSLQETLAMLPEETSRRERRETLDTIALIEDVASREDLLRTLVFLDLITEEQEDELERAIETLEKKPEKIAQKVINLPIAHSTSPFPPATIPAVLLPKEENPKEGFLGVIGESRRLIHGQSFTKPDNIVTASLMISQVKRMLKEFEEECRDWLAIAPSEEEKKNARWAIETIENVNSAQDILDAANLFKFLSIEQFEALKVAVNFFSEEALGRVWSGEER